MLKRIIEKQDLQALTRIAMAAGSYAAATLPQIAARSAWEQRGLLFWAAAFGLSLSYLIITTIG
jgi:hypothetical protein